MCPIVNGKLLEYPVGYDADNIHTAPFKEQLIVALRKKYHIESDLFDIMTFNVMPDGQLCMGGQLRGFEPYHYFFDLAEWETIFKDGKMFHHALDSIGLDAVSKRQKIDLENNYNGFK